mmetsp:Transcript_23862/g.43202  ORF Transcript_23862/g.43202 Transcript_23862/m.43202 type:complete len:327 (+) Transcript_23862:799-1779(+)
MGHRLTHTHVGKGVRVSGLGGVFQRVRLVREAQHDDPRLDPLDHLDFAIAGQARGVLDGHGVDQVHIAGQECGHGGGRVLDRGQLGAGDVMLCRVPPPVEGFKHGAQAWLARGHAEGTGAVRVQSGVVARLFVGQGSAIRLGPAAVHHHPVCDAVGKDRVGGGCHDVDGIVVHHNDIGHGRKPAARIRGLVAGALVGKEHISGVKGAAIVEGHALAQCKPPTFSCADGFPSGGQRRLDRHIFAAAHKPLIDVVEKAQHRRGVYRMGVHRLRVGGFGPFEFFGKGRGGEQGGRQQCRADHGSSPRIGVSHSQQQLHQLWAVSRLTFS